MKKLFLMALAPCVMLSCGSKKTECAGEGEHPDTAVTQRVEDEVKEDGVKEKAVLKLPVSIEQLAKDWREASAEIYIYDDNLINQYQVTDLDGDGNPEVLLHGSDPGSPSALLFYKDGKMVNSHCASDGYSIFSIGKGEDGSGWFAEEYDNHGGDYRIWSTSYFKVAHFDIEPVGEKVISRDGIDEEGEDYKMSEDCTVPKNVKIPDMEEFSNLKGWITVKLDFSQLPPREN